MKDRMPRLGRAVTGALEERKLRQEYQRLVAIVTSSHDAIVSMSPDGVIESWNAGAERLYGYAAEETEGRAAQMLMPVDHAEDLDEMLSTAWRGERVESFDTVCLRKDGRRVDVSLTISPILTPARDIIGFAWIARDVTARRRAEEALRNSEERTRFALEAGGVGVWDADLRTGKATWSRTLEAIHGLAPGTFVGTFEGFVERIHPDDRESVRTAIELAASTNTDAAIEYRTIWPDASLHWIVGQGRHSRTEFGDPSRVVGIGMDVTERKQLEAQFLQAQKMEAIGQLAGGVAHDFNNLLTAILGYAEILAEGCDEADHRQSDIGEIQKAAERAAGLTRQLLAFSRRQILQPAVLDLNVVIENLAAMLPRLIGEDVELRLRLDPRVGRVKADAGQIEQVLVNLAVNARDAMPQGGTLTVETQDVELDSAYFERHASVLSEPGRFVMVAVSDTGTGMDSETQRHVFEPFFTTKPLGKGTGLGLATVYGIVKQSNGYVWVYSEPGHGTTVKIYLPCVDSPACEEPDAAVEKVVAPGGSETVLLVEDEESVRLLSRTLLERSGYRVLEAANPNVAVEVAAQEVGPIDLLLTDVVMPGESGPELFDRLTLIRPEMRVCYMSGYTDQATVRRGVLPPSAPFLQKPFTASGLVGKVREVLDASTKRLA